MKHFDSFTKYCEQPKHTDGLCWISQSFSALKCSNIVIRWHVDCHHWWCRSRWPAIAIVQVTRYILLAWKVQYRYTISGFERKTSAVYRTVGHDATQMCPWRFYDISICRVESGMDNGVLWVFLCNEQSWRCKGWPFVGNECREVRLSDAYVQDLLCTVYNAEKNFMLSSEPPLGRSAWTVQW